MQWSAPIDQSFASRLSDGTRGGILICRRAARSSYNGRTASVQMPVVHITMNRQSLERIYAVKQSCSRHKPFTMSAVHASPRGLPCFRRKPSLSTLLKGPSGGMNPRTFARLAISESASAVRGTCGRVRDQLPSLHAECESGRCRCPPFAGCKGQDATPVVTLPHSSSQILA